jgi:oligopeptide/dipeptide ABC transporter ATP-binding protein
MAQALSRERLSTIPGTVPDAASMPEGCRFAPRCKRAIERCASDAPLLHPVEDRRHAVACWNPV